MALQLILGNAGAGKTQCLYERVIQESIENPHRNYLVIVPEQFTMQTQKELVKRHPNGGIINIDVLSFERLAHRIFGEVGSNFGPVLDDEGKNLILRKIAKNYEGELKLIGKNLRKFGYLSEVKSIISEFKQYDIDVQKLEELEAVIPENSMLGYKLADIKVLYKGFYEYLENKYITGEELLDRLSKVVGESNILKDSVITLDGFTGFTPVQNRLLQELLQVCAGIYVTVTIDEKQDPFHYQGVNELFAMSKETIRDFLQLARDHQVEIADPVYLHTKPVYRFRENPELGFLESEIFRYSGKQFMTDLSLDKKQRSAIQAYVLRNPMEEAMWVASEIRRLVRTKGYRFQDIAVITSSIEAYGLQMRRACEQYHIPMFSDQKRSILLNAFVEHIRSMLAMVDANYTYETVFRFLKSGFTPLERNHIELLENYVLSRGIKGFKNWQAPWQDSNPHKVEELLVLNQVRVMFVEYMQETQMLLKQKNKTIQDICVALYNFWDTNQMQEVLQQLEQELETQGELALAKEFNQIYGVVIELLEKLVELLGEERVGLKEFIELFDAGIQEARIGVIPPSMDAVVVGDLTRTRLDHVKVLFFMGMNDVHLPGKLGGGGLLTDRDRESLEEKKVRLKANGKEQIYIQKFYLYLTLTKPSEQLILTYAKTSAEGKSIRPAYVIGDLQHLFPTLSIQEVEMTRDVTSDAQVQECTPEVAIYSFVDGLRNAEIRESDAWQALYQWFQKQPAWKSQIDTLIQAHGYQKSTDALTQKVAQQLYGKQLQNSVTRLEKFAACPYAHFLTYGLGLKERELHEFQPVDLGNIFHSAIEYYSHKVVESKVAWSTLSQAQQEQWANEAVEVSVAEYSHALLYQSEREQYNIERIKRLMRRSVWAVTKQLERGVFVPEGFEVAFGGRDELASTHFHLSEGQDMVLRGKIDRVDLCKQGEQNYVKVLDYKTGSKELSLSELYHGLQLQLFVYLNVALEIETKKSKQPVIPAGVLYYRMNDPMVEISGEYHDLSEEEQKQQVEGSILENLVPDGLVNEGANVIALLDEEFEGKSKAIPVTKTTKGELKATSKAVSQENFSLIREFTNQKVQELGQEIVAGNIDILPYQSEKSTGCDYCQYQQVCQFDCRIKGNAYKEIENYTRDEVLEIIRTELEEKGGK